MPPDPEADPEAVPGAVPGPDPEPDFGPDLELHPGPGNADAPPAAPEFARPIRPAGIGPEGLALDLVAEPAERAALAARFGILGIPALAARLRLRPAPDGTVRVHGELSARVVQECVVSFDPVEQAIQEPIEWRLLPDGTAPSDGPEDAEEILASHGLVDLGEALAEQLALALDPYPRAPDATLPAGLASPAEHPFARLAGLRRGPG